MITNNNIIIYIYYCMDCRFTSFKILIVSTTGLLPKTRSAGFVEPWLLQPCVTPEKKYTFWLSANYITDYSID